MPETRGHSLESIQEGFQAIATRKPEKRVRRLFTGPSMVSTELANTSGALSEGVLAGPMRIELGSV